MAEVEKTRQLARLQIHVERVIGLLRNKYTILQGVIPITLIKRPSDTSVATIDKIVTISAALIKYIKFNCIKVNNFIIIRD